MKTLFALVLTLVSSSAFAHGLPEGIYSGSVFNATPMDDLCQLTSATVTINDTGNGTYQLIAQENGFWQYPMSGTCGREFYGTLSPVEGA